MEPEVAKDLLDTLKSIHQTQRDIQASLDCLMVEMHHAGHMIAAAFLIDLPDRSVKEAAQLAYALSLEVDALRRRREWEE